MIKEWFSNARRKEVKKDEEVIMEVVGQFIPGRWANHSTGTSSYRDN